jgi:hypothetical protein
MHARSRRLPADRIVVSPFSAISNTESRTGKPSWNAVSGERSTCQAVAYSLNRKPPYHLATVLSCGSPGPRTSATKLGCSSGCVGIRYVGSKTVPPSRSPTTSFGRVRCANIPRRTTRTVGTRFGNCFRLLRMQNRMANGGPRCCASAGLPLSAAAEPRSSSTDLSPNISPQFSDNATGQMYSRENRTAPGRPA